MEVDGRKFGLRMTTRNVQLDKYSLNVTFSYYEVRSSLDGKNSWNKNESTLIVDLSIDHQFKWVSFDQYISIQKRN